MVDGDSEGTYVYRWRDEARKIFVSTLNSPDPKVVLSSKELVNRLVARGLLDFRELL